MPEPLEIARRPAGGMPGGKAGMGAGVAAWTSQVDGDGGCSGSRARACLASIPAFPPRAECLDHGGGKGRTARRPGRG